MKWKGQIDSSLAQHATFDDKRNENFHSDIPHSKGITGQKHFFRIYQVQITHKPVRVV